MSPSMLQVAKCQDIIGWKLFLEGQITKEIRLLQNFHCAVSPCHTNGAEWVKHFIFRLLHISHVQWVLRNCTLYNQTRGYLRLQDQRQVLEEMDRLVDKDPANIPQESRFLLEMDFSSLLCSSFEHQSYWVMAMKAVRRAGRDSIVCQSRCGASAWCLELRRRACHPTVNTDTVVHQIYKDTVQVSHTTQRRPHPVSIETAILSNKHLKKPE